MRRLRGIGASRGLDKILGRERPGAMFSCNSLDSTLPASLQSFYGSDTDRTQIGIRLADFECNRDFTRAKNQQCGLRPLSTQIPSGRRASYGVISNTEPQLLSCHPVPIVVP